MYTYISSILIEPIKIEFTIIKIGNKVSNSMKTIFTVYKRDKKKLKNNELRISTSEIYFILRISYPYELSLSNSSMKYWLIFKF